MVYFKSYDTKLTSFIWKWFLFLLFFSFSHFCFAQITPQPAFRNLTTDDGLPSSEVYEVHEDSNGYLWFSTDNGVSRYDGYTFKNFGADDGLSCNVVFHFFEDHTGRLWMNSLTGEFFYFEDERFYPYEFNHIIKGYQERYWGVGRFFFDHERTLFFKMNSVGILKIDSLGKDTIYGRNNYGATILEISGRALSSVVFTDSSVDTLTGNSLARTLHKNDISTIQLINGKSAEKILYQRGVSSRSKNMRLIHLGPQEYLFLYGMEVLHIKDQALVWQSPEPFSKFLPCFKQMEDGTIFISHDNGKGVRKYKDLKAVKNEDYELWLDDIIISDVFIDSKGGYWFTTIGNGVYYVPSSSIKVFNEESGLRSSNISTFAIKDHTSIYFADQEGDFYLLNHQRNQIQALPKSDQDVPIISLYYDTSTNILWSGAPPLRFFEKKQWKDLITDSDRKRSIKGTLIRVKPSADYKSLWGGGPFGFASIDLNINRLNILSSEIEGLKRTRTFVVYENSKKQIFVSNLNGFFELKDNQLIPVNKDNPSFQLRIEDIKEDQDGNLILGTKGAGVLIWAGNNVVEIGEKDGLLSNMIEHVEVDDDNNIWVATLNGLSLIYRQNNIDEAFIIVSYTKAHGLPSNEINFLKSQGDTLWLATPKGLVLFPKEQLYSCQSSHVFLENFIVNNEVIKERNELVFKYDENNIRIEYLSINSKLQGNIEYKYRLNNRLAWQYTQERAANLIDLSPGLYRFEVQAKDENEEWSPSLNVEFLIKPPFWERAWFIVLAFLGFIALAWLAVNRYIARIKRDNEIEKEMQSLKASALQAQMNPHFVFNCLNAIQSFIAGKESEKATRYLAKFAMLVRNNLNASVNKVVTLDEEIQTIENYLSFEKMRFQKKLNYSIIVDPSLNIYELEIPPLLTLPYVENAVIHGLLQSPRQGELEIKYFNQVDDIVIEIIDNGLGIFQTQKMKKKNQLEGIHKSVGMSISKKMLEIFNERSTKKDLLIEELKNDLGEIQGTRIMLKIKVKHKGYDS